MAKSENQKLKLISIRDILLRKTDEEHPISTGQIIEELAKLDIKAERKSIYQDIQTLEDMGLDIVKLSGRTNCYYVASRDFELPELKMLVDVVQSAKFITEKKSRQLIEKLEAQTSQYAAKQLSRNVVIANRSKTDNENIFYNIDIIYHAMAQNHKIEFAYYEWNMQKEMVVRKGGELYSISPWALIWDDENYYMLGFDQTAGIMKHYRVDKMKQMKEAKEEREGKEEMDKLDLAAFSKATFGMFAGEETMVKLLCHESLIGVLLDRFGKNITIRPVNEHEFEARVPVKVSPVFYGWLTTLGSKARIAGPEKVKEEYKNYLQDILNQL